MEMGLGVVVVVVVVVVLVGVVYRRCRSCYGRRGGGTVGVGIVTDDVGVAWLV